MKHVNTITTYVFKGEAIPKPEAGTYDPTNWTPPTHRMYRVEFHGGKSWRLLSGLSGEATIASGHWERPSLVNAIEIVKQFVKEARPCES